MTKTEPTAVTRGSFPLTVQVPWRLDGAASTPDAPLVLCLHGMGMTHDFFALLLQRLFPLPCRFLIPNAPYPVEVRREGRVGGAWYAYDGNQDHFREELDRSERIVLDLLRSVEEAEGLAPSRRYLFGFSQGGYLGSYVAIKNPDVFDGLIVSGARVKTEFLGIEMREAAASGFEALLCHGSRDPSVSPDAAVQSRDHLASAGISVTLETLDSGHSVGREQLKLVAEWLRPRIGGEAHSEPS